MSYTAFFNTRYEFMITGIAATRGGIWKKNKWEVIYMLHNPIKT